MIVYDREIISLGSRGSLNVDRAIAEFRSGRPVCEPWPVSCRVVVGRVHEPS